MAGFKNSERALFVARLRQARICEGPDSSFADLAAEVAAIRASVKEDLMKSKSTAPAKGSKAERIIELWRERQDVAWVAQQVGCRRPVVLNALRYWCERLGLPAPGAPAAPAEEPGVEADLASIRQCSQEVTAALPDAQERLRRAQSDERARIMSMVVNRLLDLAQAASPAAPERLFEIKALAGVVRDIDALERAKVGKQPEEPE